MFDRLNEMLLKLKLTLPVSHFSREATNKIMYVVLICDLHSVFIVSHAGAALGGQVSE